MPEADPTLTDRQTRALVRAGYDAIARQYTELAATESGSAPRRAQSARLLARLSPRSRVLELGCGGGAPVATSVVDAGHSYVGVDISPRQIELARDLVPDGRFIVGDALSQRFEAASFDAVVMLYAITHVQRDRWSELLVKVRGWLRTGGWLLLNVPHHESPGWLEEDFLGLGATSWTNSHDPATALQLVADAGLAVVEACQIGEDESDPESWVWILARATSPMLPHADPRSHS